MSHLIVPDNLLQKAKNAPQKDAQDLKCGDIYFFRDKLYICLSNFIDRRHTQAIVTGIAQEHAVPPLSNIVVTRFFRTFRVPVVHHVDLILSVLHNDSSEINQDCQDRLSSLMEYND